MTDEVTTPEIVALSKPVLPASREEGTNGALMLATIADAFQRIPTMEKTIAERDAQIADLQAKLESANAASKSAVELATKAVEAERDAATATLTLSDKALRRALGFNEKHEATIVGLKADAEAQRAEAAAREAKLSADLIEEHKRLVTASNTLARLETEIEDHLRAPALRHNPGAEPSNALSVLRLAIDTLRRMDSKAG